jgi:hypothetical protein
MNQGKDKFICILNEALHREDVSGEVSRSRTHFYLLALDAGE